jgi:DNA-binding MarR family transcriptional regulator
VSAVVIVILLKVCANARNYTDACTRTQVPVSIATVGDVDQFRAWRALLLAQDAVVRAIEEQLSRAGVIDLSSYDVLLELNAATDRRLRMQELAARTVLSRTRTSRLVDELVDRGFVERRPDPDDRRSSFACITADGRTALRTAAPVYAAGIEQHFTSLLTERDAAALTRALEKVVEVHRATTIARRLRR